MGARHDVNLDPLSLPWLGGDVSSDTGEPGAGDLVGPYRLLSLLGRGGMGSVWLAEQIDGRLSRKLAIKLPSPGMAQGDWRRRFERSEEHTSELQSHSDLHSFPTRRSSDLLGLARRADRWPLEPQACYQAPVAWHGPRGLAPPLR